MFGAIHLVRAYFKTNFRTPSPFTYIYGFRITPLFAYVISSIWYSPLPFWLCLFAMVCLFACFLILFYFKNSRIDVFVSHTHYFLASHSVSSSLPRKTFSLMLASKCRLFYLSWSLRKLSYANVKKSCSRRTATVIVTVLTNVLTLSWEIARAITLSNSNKKPQIFPANTPFLNEGNGKFLQIKQDTIKQNMKRDIVSAYVHIRRDNPLPLSAPVHILNEIPSIPPAAHVLNEWYISQPKDK